MLEDHARAEDVVQDVFLSAVGAIRGGQRPDHVAAWLREIARRACIDQWRQTTRRGEVSLDEPGRLAQGDAARLADDEWLTRVTDDREAVATLRRAFADLPALQHAVLVQRELEGRSPGEIAERLGVSHTVVEGQLARGRRTLARAYRELQSGERCAAARRLCDASLRGRLGVRDRHRLATHLRGCDPCRRHAHAHGVDGTLIPRSLAARATVLLPLPLLRRWSFEAAFAGEAAGGALSTKVLVGAAVLAAGGSGVYAAGDLPRGGRSTASQAASVRAPAGGSGSPRPSVGGTLPTGAGATAPVGPLPAPVPHGVFPGTRAQASARVTVSRPIGGRPVEAVAVAGIASAPVRPAAPTVRVDPPTSARRAPSSSGPTSSGAGTAIPDAPVPADGRGPADTDVARAATPVLADPETAAPAAASVPSAPAEVAAPAVAAPAPAPEAAAEPAPADDAGPGPDAGVLGILEQVLPVPPAPDAPADSGDEAPSGGS
jgi:RNA polymerase sigma factor (sigma-70 family)